MCGILVISDKSLNKINAINSLKILEKRGPDYTHYDIIDNLFILKINNPPAWDQGYHLSNVFKMYNILGDQGINISEKFNQLLNVTDSYRGPLTYFVSSLFFEGFQ